MTRKIVLGYKDTNAIFADPTAEINNRLINLGQSFPQQYKFTEDSSRYIVAQCSRRAGKSNGLAIRFFKTLQRNPKCQCIYLSLTRESALSIMWPVLQEINDKYDLGCKFIESKLIMIHPNGAKLRLIGADMKNFIKRLKGIKSPGVAIDEAQDFGSHLQSLVDDVIVPCLADYEDGWLAICGTPGPVPQGYFFEITQEKKYGYSFHEWTILDNPYMPNPSAFIADLKKKRGWEENNPTLQREWLNKWVLDRESLWIKYNKEVNHFESRPPNIKDWHHIMGIDIGYRDADAIAILAWSLNDSCTYLIEEQIETKQGITELVNQVETLAKKYNVDKMVIDEGGLGKKIAEEIRRRHGIPVQQADKARKQENVGFLNDALRQGRFKAKSASRFAKDSYVVQIDWEKSRHDRIVIKKDPHSDIIDAVLYAFKESPAFTYQEQLQAPKYGTKEWADTEETKMFEAELEKAQKEQETSRWNLGYDD